MNKMDALKAEVGRHLTEMAKLFKSPVLVSFIARVPHDEEGRFDVLITNDQEPEILKLIQRRMEQS